MITKNLKNEFKFAYMHFCYVYASQKKIREEFKPPNPPLVTALANDHLEILLKLNIVNLQSAELLPKWVFKPSHGLFQRFSRLASFIYLFLFFIGWL